MAADVHELGAFGWMCIGISAITALSAVVSSGEGFVEGVSIPELAAEDCPSEIHPFLFYSSRDMAIARVRLQSAQYAEAAEALNSSAAKALRSEELLPSSDPAAIVRATSRATFHISPWRQYSSDASTVRKTRNRKNGIQSTISMVALPRSSRR